MTESLQRKLAAHLSEMPVTIDGLPRTVTMGPGVALDCAGQLLSIVREHDEARGRKRDDEPEPGPRDPEVGTIGAIVAALNELDDGESAGQPHGIYWRVLSYLASRYGYVLATED